MDLFILKMSERQTKAGNQENFQSSQTFTLSFTLCRHAEQLLSSCLCSKVTLTLFQSLIHWLSTCWTTFVFMSMLKSHSLTFTLSHSLTLTLSHTHTFTLSHSHSPTLSLCHFLTLTLSLFHSLIHSFLTCWTTFVFMYMLKNHSLTFTLSHSRTLTLSHSFNVSFNHSRHAEQVLFSCLGSKLAVYSRKLKWNILGPQPQHHPPLWVWSS